MKRQPRSCDNSLDPLLEDGVANTTLSSLHYVNPCALHWLAALLQCCYLACPNSIPDSATFVRVWVPAVHHACGSAVCLTV